MSEVAPLLLEIGCEEIPARMIRHAAEELGRRVLALLDREGLSHGRSRSWGGPRRLAVWVESVQGRQPDREETVIGPPARVAFDAENRPTAAATGFAGKQGIAADRLRVIATPKGDYAGFDRAVRGRDVGEVLAASLPEDVAKMPFPKTMRWGDGSFRWVRPVHWVVALHGETILEVELFGCRSGNESRGHRFLGAGPVVFRNPADYADALRDARVIADPAQRRQDLQDALRDVAAEFGGAVVEDEGLLSEAAELVEWPAVVGGGFDPSFLDLPPDLLVTTLRHHQKCFSVCDPEGRLLPHFLAVSNNDEDREGHIRRGNEWVVGGRLDDARFFWKEDRKLSLTEHASGLERVLFHARAGSFADKARRMESMARALGTRVALDEAEIAHAARAAELAKADLVTGTVGEFPELQGRVGGLLLRAEGQPEGIAAAVYAHYRPEGPDDELPATAAGRIVSIADKLDSAARLVAAGEIPTGSRDPFGLRRAIGGVFRIVIDSAWPLSLSDLAEAAGEAALLPILLDRLQHYLHEDGWSAKEVRAVLRSHVGEGDATAWPLHDVIARLEAIATVRDREDFAHLADLTKRVDNILAKGQADFDDAARRGGDASNFEETKQAARTLSERIDQCGAEIRALEERLDYARIVDVLATFVAPVEQFFDEVLVLDREDPGATLQRRDLLVRLGDVLTRCFDIRELAGEADRR
jgi:glycyl-tRNA synthetase beta chain